MSHAANGDIVIGATPMPTDTSDTARPRCWVEPAHHGGDHRREEAAGGNPDHDAEGELELAARWSRGWRGTGRAPSRIAPTSTTGRGPMRSLSAPQPNPAAPIARKLSVIAVEIAVLDQPVDSVIGLQKDREREHRADRDAGHEGAERDDDPAVVATSFALTHFHPSSGPSYPLVEREMRISTLFSRLSRQHVHRDARRRLHAEAVGDELAAAPTAPCTRPRARALAAARRARSPAPASRLSRLQTGRLAAGFCGTALMA